MPSSPYAASSSTTQVQAGPLAVNGGTTSRFAPAALTNAWFYIYDHQNNYIQNAIQNTSSAVNASSDFVATADTGTDSAKYINMGINNSGYSVGTWTINGALDGYLFVNSGGLAVGTDTAGKNLVLFTGGTLAANARLTLSDTQSLTSVPRASTAKTVVNNGATTTYTLPTTSDYIYITTSAASLTLTYPAAAASLDGAEIIVVTSASVATAAFSSSGATFVGAPASFAANTPVRFKYDHASLKWYLF